MQQMEWRNGKLQPVDSRVFLGQLFLAWLCGDVELEQEIRMVIETDQAQRYLNTLGRMPKLHPTINAYRCGESVEVKSYRTLESRPRD